MFWLRYFEEKEKRFSAGVSEYAPRPPFRDREVVCESKMIFWIVWAQGNHLLIRFPRLSGHAQSLAKLPPFKMNGRIFGWQSPFDGNDFTSPLFVTILKVCLCQGNMMGWIVGVGSDPGFDVEIVHILKTGNWGRSSSFVSENFKMESNNLLKVFSSTGLNPCANMEWFRILSRGLISFS